MSDIVSVSRPNKQNKTKVTSLRMLETEYQQLEELKAQMGFKSLGELFNYSVDILRFLKEKNEQMYQFYIGNNGKQDYQEVKFELFK